MVRYPPAPVVAFAPSPMLAQLQTRLPIGDQWRYEPKLDGFRGLLWRRGDAVQLLSRNLKDLTHWFPELANAGKALPPNTLVDGEIIIVNTEGASDFGALQRRLGMARRDARVAGERPIRSRWQHDAVPAWRRVVPLAVVEVAYTTLDGGRWLRQPARFLRWRPDRSVSDCGLEQLGATVTRRA